MGFGKLFLNSVKNYFSPQNGTTKIEHVVDGRLDKYKDKFVARGFSQKESIDYEEFFAF